MCTEAGVPGNKTNHSLRVSGASCLFDAGVPERIIQQRTGHRSVEALRLYEQITDDQNMDVSKILHGEKRMFNESKGNQIASDTVQNTELSTVPPDEKKICDGMQTHSNLGSVSCNNCTVNVYQVQPSTMTMPGYSQFQPSAMTMPGYMAYNQPPLYYPALSSDYLYPLADITNQCSRQDFHIWWCHPRF